MSRSNVPGFSAVALDHGDHPRNHGPLEEFTGHAVITGPCGDTMEFWLRVVAGVVIRVSFATDGCRSSLACGSMATTLVEGRPLDEALKLRSQDILGALGGVPEKAEHCSVLAAKTLAAAGRDHLDRNPAPNRAP